MGFWATQLFNGISYGGLLFLFASGLSLIFGVMKIVNLAHGSYFLLSGYLAISVMMWIKDSYILGLITGMLVVMLISIFMVKGFLQKISGNVLGQVLITTGFALVFQDIALILWGGRPYTIKVPEVILGSLVFGQMYFPKIRLFILGVAIVVGIMLWVLQSKTKAGAMIRAAVDNPEMARGMGINVPLVSVMVFALGAMLAALAGVISGSFIGVYPGLDFEILPYAFVVVILGGRGSLGGAMIGSLAVGLIDNFGKVLFPELSYFTLFLPMVLTLAIKPTGLFGKA
jgi:branched-chain amino acid transport system permease protein